MKEFHSDRGLVWKKALTVGELMEKLSQHPADMPVLAEWEGQLMPLGFHAQVEPHHWGVPSEMCGCLILNAEYD